MATWVGITPPVTYLKGGRGSSSKLVRLTVSTTAFVFGSMTASVLLSSLQMKTRSGAPVGAACVHARRLLDNAPTATPAARSERRVTCILNPHLAAARAFSGKVETG